MAEFIPPPENGSAGNQTTVSPIDFITDYTTKTFNFTPDVGPIKPTVTVTVPIPKR